MTTVRDLEKRKSMMLPSLGEAMGNISPPQLPSLPYSSGLLSHVVHGWKVKKQAQSYKVEAEIAADQNAMVKSRLDMVMQITTFSDRVKLEFRRMDHETTVMNMREYEYQCEIRKKEAEAMEAEFSAKAAELDFKARLKAMKEEYGDDL